MISEPIQIKQAIKSFLSILLDIRQTLDRQFQQQTHREAMVSHLWLHSRINSRTGLSDLGAPGEVSLAVSAFLFTTSDKKTSRVY